MFAMLGNDRGGNAEYVVVKATEAAGKLERLSHVEAAAVRLAGITAWQGLFDHCDPQIRAVGSHPWRRRRCRASGDSVCQGCGRICRDDCCCRGFRFRPARMHMWWHGSYERGLCSLKEGAGNCFSIRYTVADKGPDRASMKSSPGRSESTAFAPRSTALPATPPASGGQPLTRTIKTCRHRSALASMHKPCPQPSQKSVAGNCPANSGGSPSRLHRSTDVAVTDDVVQLPVTQLEEALCLTVGVIFQTHGAQHRILIGNSDRRSRATRYGTGFRTEIFGA